MSAYDSPRLLADIGATFARFALEQGPGRIDHVVVLNCDDYAGFEEVTRAYLQSQAQLVRHAAIAIANPIDGDQVRMTNRNWAFSIEAVRQALQLDTLLVVNDFTALAMALPRLSAADRVQIGAGSPRENAVIGLLGPGTGLGVSGLIPTEERWVTLGSEGGHASFSPSDARELSILQYAWQRYAHVSAERLVSGGGIELCYEALSVAAGRGAQRLAAPLIVDAALSGKDAICVDALQCFCAMLGTIAGDLALTLGAFGGVYIGGGIVPRLGQFFAESAFRQRFEAKGRFATYLAGIPTYVISAAQPALLGVSAILSDALRHHTGNTGDSHLLALIRRSRDSFSRAEQQVADLVMLKPRSILSEPVAGIARMADVSQPTVIRFCRSLGFEGLQDFKLKLASGLTGTLPVRHSQVRHSDGVPDISAKVLDNTASAILRLRDTLNMAAIDAATELLSKAKRLELYGIGNSGLVAQDGQHKFFRCGVPCVAYADTHLQKMSARTLAAGDVVIAVSSSGRVAELLEAVALAQAGGAAVIAITTSQSPLARRADVSISVDHDEDSDRFLAMISRILHLLVIDILTVGLVLHGAEPRIPDEDQPGQISHVS
jgi:glucokinase